jgi:hypothetical protein
MDHRTFRLTRRAVLLGIPALALAGAGGCAAAMFTPMYVLFGSNTPAECKLLKGSKVAVVCRANATRQYRNAQVDRDLAGMTSAILKTNVSRIKIVDHRKLADWLDNNTWDEYVEVGKALDADYVLGIDMDRFDLHAGPALLQGKADLRLQLVDVKKGETVFQKDLPNNAYPNNRQIASSDVGGESVFRQQFVAILAGRIARMFYDADRYDNFAEDSRTIE